MSTTTVLVLFLAVCGSLLSGNCVTAVSAKPSPFLSRSEAHQMLGSANMGKYKGLTASLGLRADISDGWEELLSSASQNTDSVSMQIDLVLQKNWLSQHEIRHLAEKAVFRSPVSMGFLNNQHMLTS